MLLVKRRSNRLESNRFENQEGDGAQVDGVVPSSKFAA
jgi:hypothetical protein